MYHIYKIIYEYSITCSLIFSSSVILLNLSFVRFFVVFHKFRFQRICDSWFLFFCCDSLFSGFACYQQIQILICLLSCLSLQMVVRFDRFSSIRLFFDGSVSSNSYHFDICFSFFLFVKPTKKSNITFSTLVFIALSSAASVECCSIIVDIVGFVAYFFVIVVIVSKNIYD